MEKVISAVSTYTIAVSVVVPRYALISTDLNLKSTRLL